METGADLWVPNDFDWSRLTELNTPTISNPAGGPYRREVCRYDPLLFALVYLRHHLKSAETDDRISLNEFHIDMCDAASEWSLLNRRPQPKEFRDCWIAPRGCGKSTWMFLIIPIWAAAFGHRKYIAMFADSGKQAKQHLDSILQEFRKNTKLRADFPRLCRSREQKGGDTANEYHSATHVTFTAYGIDASTLGAKSENQRPDFILLDDIEPPGEKFTLKGKEARRNTMVNAIFAMNPNAVVWIAGTTVAYDSLIHDIVRYSIGALDDARSRWIRSERINGRYYPAIMTDERGNERSLWPERWPLDFLQEDRQSKDFQLNYMNNPTGGVVDSETGEIKGEFWEETDFGEYGANWAVDDMVLVIDPATTSHAKSDQTGIAVVSVDAGRTKVCVEEALGVRLRPKPLREYVLDILEINPLISTVLIETNQGGDYVVEGLSPLPRGVKVIDIKEHAPKKFRVRQFLTYDERGWVSYRRPMQALHTQQINFPNGLHDDIVDATSKGVHFFLKDRLPRR